MIELKNVTVTYKDGKTPVKELSLKLNESGVVALTGASGCGKTTVLRAAAGLIAPTAGEVTGLEGKRLSMVFQEDRLLPWLNVLDNVLFSGDVKKDGDAEAALECLAAVELDGRENDQLDSLSGGMKRRVAIARALHYGGVVIFMDEPYKGLDEALAARVHERVKARFKLVVAAVHERREAEALGADEVVEL